MGYSIPRTLQGGKGGYAGRILAHRPAYHTLLFLGSRPFVRQEHTPNAEWDLCCGISLPLFYTWEITVL